jgi:hypothetical protein
VDGGCAVLRCFRPRQDHEALAVRRHVESCRIPNEQDRLAGPRSRFIVREGSATRRQVATMMWPSSVL